MHDADPQLPGALMAAEIAEQPDILAGLLAARDELDEAARRIAGARPRFVLIAARGTSDHAALYAKYLVEIRRGLPAGLASPSAFTLYGATPDLTDVLFLAISQSGRSPDLVESMAVARACGALTMAVTNTPDSPLALGAEISIDVRAGVERAVAATKTYTAELLALLVLLGGDGAAHEAAGLPEAAARTLAANGDERLAAVTAPFRYANRIVVSGRGYSYPTAREAALKLMETSYVSAQAFSGADLLHGPLAMIDASVPVIAVTTPGRSGAAMRPVLDRLAEAGAEVLPVGPRRGLAVAATGLPEHVVPIVEIMPLQLLARQLAVERGLDPDAPRGLSKVTHTR
ncbi:MAG TPA: SIS domain-containing protein [Solirubrobacteraceae bacterium]|nr:SIS domain-containing protein [Solirubrobacteraceae bacterium]